MTPTNDQQAAIDEQHPSTLLIACPGSGKSTTLVERILEHNNTGEKVIVSTFTQRAGQELRRKLTNASFHPHYCGTDHGLCLRILRQQNPKTSVMDEETADAVLAGVIDQLRAGTTVTAVRKAMAATQGEIPAKHRPVVLAYQRLMHENACYDYDSLLLFGGKAAPTYGDGWRLYVDEYQDTTLEQDLLYDSLNCTSRFFVGDPDQCVYGFRGSRLYNILERQKISAVHRLSLNFRSGPAVVETANDVIKHNAERAESPARMKAVKTGTGSVTVARYDGEEHERQAIVEWVKEAPDTSTAILVRYNAQRIQIEEALRNARIPMPSPAQPMPRDIRVLRAWLALIANPSNEIAQQTWLRVTLQKEHAEAAIERRAYKEQPKPPADWTAWANTMGRMKFSRAAIAAVWDAHKLTDSVDPFEILLALGSKEPAQPFARQVAVLTFHAAKGLEFDRVWIAAADRPEDAANHIKEEERRLFYVAITRARNELRITHASRRCNDYTHRPEIRVPVQFVLEAAESCTNGG